MKQLPFLIAVLIAALALSACASTAKPAASDACTEAVLTVSGGEISKAYTRADLEALTATEATFKDVTYKGVLISTLLKDAGFDPSTIKAVKGVASDGYAVNYDTNQVLVDNVIVAYATAGGELTAEDGSFRMVLPDAEGKLNMRMLVELQVMK